MDAYDRPRTISGLGSMHSEKGRCKYTQHSLGSFQISEHVNDSRLSLVVHLLSLSPGVPKALVLVFSNLGVYACRISPSSRIHGGIRKRTELVEWWQEWFSIR